MFYQEISLIIPFYNEKKRIIFFFQNLKNYIKSSSLVIEIIMINDGSEDDSGEMVTHYIKELLTYNNLSIKKFDLNRNMGKGAAIKKGIELANNKWIVTMDIDLAVPFSEIDVFFNNYFDKKVDVYFGSRGLENSQVKTNSIRKFLGFSFSNFVTLFLNLNINDTQCGFKIYNKTLGKKIFMKVTDRGYTHDIQVALICKYNNILVKEFPVTWTHKDGSKINIIIDSFKMFFKLTAYSFQNKNNLRF